LCRNKDKIDPIHQSGIYKVNCDSCNMCYIGQTGRNFLTRMKEHRRCWRNGDETSLLAKHILQTSHCCRFQPEVLHLDNKGIRLDVLEQFEITQSDINILMNEQIFVTQSPLLKIPFPKTNGQTLSSPTS
jgi:arginyl-tRNA--protein-N-Asp/Glu arginylyltransferase